MSYNYGPYYYAGPPSYAGYPSWQPPAQYSQPDYSGYGKAPSSRPKRQGTTTAPPRQVLAHRHRTDPAAYGWVLEGCNVQSKVEYWVSPDGCTKMDYYPTTGTVKTMMDHPTQGKTQMFRKNLSEEQFQRVLAQPRAHTGKGYQYRHTGGYGR